MLSLEEFKNKLKEIRKGTVFRKVFLANGSRT